MKVKGQGHLKMKVKVTKTTRIAFLHNFSGKIFYPWCLFGVMSQFKGQRSRSLEGQIWCYSFLSLIIKHFLYVFSPFECWCDISSDYFIWRF